MLVNSVEQSPLQHTGSLQASLVFSTPLLHLGIRDVWLCQQQDPTLQAWPRKFINICFFQNRGLRHFHKRTRGAGRENGTIYFRAEYRLQMHNMNWALSGAKPLQHFQTMRQQTTLALSLLTCTNFGRRQVQNGMMWSFLTSAWQLVLYHCIVSTCGHLGQKRNIKKMLKEKAEWTSVSKDSRQLATPVPRRCCAWRMIMW